MPFAVVTGANRGIGLALTTALAARGHQVLAACRSASAELKKLGVEVAEGVDVATDAGIAALVAAVGARSVDLLVNNAGIAVWGEDVGALDVDGIRRQFEVNALGPLRVTSALAPRLGQGAKVALITSRMGSIDDNTSGGGYGYRMSKAALNMAGKSLAHDLKGKGVSVAILHPGMVKTDMIKGHGDGAGLLFRGLRVPGPGRRSRLRARALVAIELKAGRFEPEHLGKLQFYLEALDRDVKKPHERPSIGLLLCATRDAEVVEYALARSTSPTLIAEYQTMLPPKAVLQTKLHEIYRSLTERAG